MVYRALQQIVCILRTTLLTHTIGRARPIGRPSLKSVVITQTLCFPWALHVLKFSFTNRWQQTYFGLVLNMFVSLMIPTIVKNPVPAQALDALLARMKPISNVVNLSCASTMTCYAMVTHSVHSPKMREWRSASRDGWGRNLSLHLPV